jgi:23S rRNA (guanosine2251-2'-O)-methyltransferase
MNSKFSKSKNFIAGRHPILEALKSGQLMEKILMASNASGENISLIKLMAKQNLVPLQLVPVEKLNSITNIQHQGVLAFKSLIQYQDLQAVIDWINGRGEVPLLVILDGVTDIRNIGAITRSAVCCGAQAIIIPDKGVGALNEDAMKASAGALELLQICRVGSLLKAIDELHLNGIKVFSSEMKASKKLYDLSLTEPCCIIMGGEEKGVQASHSKAADERFSIPMAGEFDSLNVSVATGIVLYEALRQRTI